MMINIVSNIILISVLVAYLIAKYRVGDWNNVHLICLVIFGSIISSLSNDDCELFGFHDLYSEVIIKIGVAFIFLNHWKQRKSLAKFPE